jgi:hypothetical protein
MRTVRATLVLCACVCFPAIASAEPIAWSYSSTGATAGQYHIDAASIPWTTAPGQTQNIYLIGGYQYPLLASPWPPQGPTLWTAVTILDATSGRSGTFNVPIQFTDPAPSQVSGWYQYTPHVGPIGRIDLVLGKNEYTVTNGPDRALTVRVVTTPEPTTFGLALVALVPIGLWSLRRK